MNPLFNMLIQRAMSNPQISQNPQAQEIIRILQSGDAQAGQQMAQNICQTRGISPEQGVQQAQQYFQQFGGGMR